MFFHFHPQLGFIPWIPLISWIFVLKKLTVFFFFNTYRLQFKTSLLVIFFFHYLPITVQNIIVGNIMSYLYFSFIYLILSMSTIHIHLAELIQHQFPWSILSYETKLQNIVSMYFTTRKADWCFQPHHTTRAFQWPINRLNAFNQPERGNNWINSHFLKQTKHMITGWSPWSRVISICLTPLYCRLMPA